MGNKKHSLTIISDEHCCHQDCPWLEETGETSDYDGHWIVGFVCSHPANQYDEWLEFDEEKKAWQRMQYCIDATDSDHPGCTTTDYEPKG